MNRDIAAESNRLAMIRLCHIALDSQTLRTRLLQRLRTIIPFDYAYFSTTDPATQFATSSVLVEEPPAWCMSVFLENEFLQEDFNKFRDMLRHRQTVGMLSEATGHDLPRSQRYREMLAPMAMDDELRVIFVTNSACWGTLCLHRGQTRRGQSQSGYTPSEAAYLAHLAPHIADGLRKALLLGNAPSGKLPDGPGVLILSEDLSIVATTVAAEHWLMELTEAEAGDKSVLPRPVRSVIAGLEAIERGLVATNRTPKVRLLTRSGQWLALYASRLRSSDSQAQISVMFEIARPAEIAPLIMQAYQLTKREGDIAQCALLGWSTTAIAANLHISSNTVQDHLKAIFAKVEVGSRGELAARIFTQQYLSQLQVDAAVDSSGQFTAPNHPSTWARTQTSHLSQNG
ncbi:MAG TPA: LuxR C-terminal-related transcriptional regulator [Ktedonobacterales bacterium]|nr:LuxR C-terminal-related transcriptional regulator [Ktedonobacterales bacterium]